MRSIVEPNKTYIDYFTSIDELVKYLETHPSKRYNSSSEGDYGFTGTKSLKEALDLCKYGDEELRKQIYEETLKFNSIESIDKIKHMLINDVVGFMPNVPNYVMGIPMNMIRDNRTMVKSKIINIAINISASWNINQKELRNNAAKYLAAINRLEQEGYRCNVYSISASHYGANNLLVTRIKTDREPMNIAKMAFPLCHPSMLRRLKFKWMETLDYDFGQGYGSPIHSPEDLLKKLFNNDKIVVLNVADKSNMDAVDVSKYLKAKGML